MFESIKRACLVFVVASLLVVGLSGAVLAAGWSDLPQSLLDDYGLSAAEVSAFSQGFPDGTWKPGQMITRAQFAKMAVDAFSIPRVNPATPSFTDVAADSMYYQYVETAKAAGLITGVTAVAFAPYDTLTHQQGYAILMRWVAKAAGVEPGLLGDAPAIAMGNLFVSTSQSLGDVIQGATTMARTYQFNQTSQAGDTIDPAGGTTRIQAAAALTRIARWLQTH